jgi:phosphatidylglycerophosphatase A
MIVIDEAVAFIALFCFLPIHFYTILAGFILFRIFDIFKPFGIAYLEHLPGVAGIMVDDLAAALAANVCIQVAYYILG